MTKTLDVVETHDHEPLGPARAVLDEKAFSARPGIGAGVARSGWVLEVVDQDCPGDRPGIETLRAPGH
jgi:hypothetical protein